METFIGTIMMFAGNFAPSGWAFCNGALLPIAQYTALFSILGTTYGGEGRPNFGLPDLRGRVPLSFGQGPNLSSYELGQQYGTETVTLQQQQMPAHTHAFGVPCSTGGADASSPQNAVNANLDPAQTYASTATPGVTMFA